MVEERWMGVGDLGIWRGGDWGAWGRKGDEVGGLEGRMEGWIEGE